MDNLFFTLFLPQTLAHNKWLIISHQISNCLEKITWKWGIATYLWRAPVEIYHDCSLSLITLFSSQEWASIKKELYDSLNTNSYQITWNKCLQSCHYQNNNKVLKCICEPHAKQTIIILVFVFQLISDAGYQGEITSVSTACHQIEVFSRVLKTSVCSFLEEGEQTIDNNLPEFSVSL